MSDPIDLYFGQSASAARKHLPSIDHHGTKIFGPLGNCIHCGLRLYDGALVSGWTHKGPDLCDDGGDFGCSDSPDTGEDGVGGHALAVTR